MLRPVINVFPGFLFMLFIITVLPSCRSEALSIGLLEKAKLRSVAIFAGRNPVAIGSGFYLGRGRIVTCLHVVEIVRGDSASTQAGTLVVERSGNRIEAKTIRSESRFDLALLDTGQTDLEPVSDSAWTAREVLREGETIFLYGSPFGLTHSLLVGTISSTDRRNTDPGYASIPFVQIQGPSFPGASGAAVFR